MEKDERPYSCTAVDCNRLLGFKRKADLNRHELIVHNHSKDFLCSYPGCDKKFSRKDNMEDHVKRIHKKVETSTGNDDKHLSPGLLTISLPNHQTQHPYGHSLRSRLSMIPEVQFQPPQSQSQYAGASNPGRKRSRKIEIDDEGGKELNKSEASGAEVKRLKQIIENQNRRIIEKDKQIAEKDAQLAILERLVERALQNPQTRS